MNSRRIEKVQIGPPGRTPWARIALLVGACCLVVFGGTELAGRLLFGHPADNPYRALYLTRGICVALFLPALVKCLMHRDHRQQSELMQRDRLALIGLLTSGIAHELKNPLAVIRSSLYLMKDKLPDSSAAAKHVQRVEKHVQSAQEVVDSLLSLARGHEAHIVSLDLAQALDEIACLVPELDGNRVHIERPQAGASVAGDRNLVRIIVLNLVLNALQAVRDRVDGAVWVTTGPELGWTVIAVRDNGPGLSRAALAELGQPLASRKPGGTGIGLALSTLLLDQLHGEIEVQSCEGEGTTFLLRLPTARGTRLGRVQTEPAERAVV